MRLVGMNVGYVNVNPYPANVENMVSYSASNRNEYQVYFLGVK
jgi:hypothetical protein